MLRWLFMAMMFVAVARGSDAPTFRVPDEFVDDERGGIGFSIPGLDSAPSSVFVKFPVALLAQEIPGYVVANGKLSLDLHVLLMSERLDKDISDRELGLSPCRDGHICRKQYGVCFSGEDLGDGQIPIVFQVFSACEGKIGLDVERIGTGNEGICPVCKGGHQLSVLSALRGRGYIAEFEIDGLNLARNKEIRYLIKRNVDTWVIYDE